MIEMEPTTRELNIVINALKEHINEKVGDIQNDLSEINSRVKTTNGRVKTLEIWRSFLLGGMTVISVFVIPLVTYIWTQRT